MPTDVGVCKFAQDKELEFGGSNGFWQDAVWVRTSGLTPHFTPARERDVSPW